MDNIILKRKLCEKFKEGHCKYGKKCTYAHGLQELNKNCMFLNKCNNEDCTFDHPEKWNPYENKKICRFDGICYKSDCKFKHINKSENKIIKDGNNKINIDEFPQLANLNNNITIK